MTEKRSMEHCLNYTGKPKCHYTGNVKVWSQFEQGAIFKKGRKIE